MAPDGDRVVTLVLLKDRVILSSCRESSFFARSVSITRYSWKKKKPTLSMIPPMTRGAVKRQIGTPAPNMAISSLLL
jgi:hypothetical protein